MSKYPRHTDEQGQTWIRYPYGFKLATGVTMVMQSYGRNAADACARLQTLLDAAMPGLKAIRLPDHMVYGGQA